MSMMMMMMMMLISLGIWRPLPQRAASSYDPRDEGLRRLVYTTHELNNTRLTALCPVLPG